MKTYLTLLAAVCFAGGALAQKPETIALYQQKIPGSLASATYHEEQTPQQASKVTDPALYFFRPDSANGTAVIICPGGGYMHLAMEKEGFDVARAFAKAGVTAFVLKYRLPSDEIMQDRSTGPLQDAQQAIWLVRKGAATYGINPGKIGIMGFSAGGHLASTLGTHYQQAVFPHNDGVSLRPDFMILIYPVIDMGKYTHAGSKKALIGAEASPEQVKLYSNQLQVTEDTPISFLVQAEDDRTVPCENTLMMATALKEHGVKAELHLYQAGGHGFGLHNKTTTEDWFSSLLSWMQQNQLR